LRMTYCLIILIKYGKYLQNPFIDKKVMDRTRHIPSNRQCWPWMSKCDLDAGSRGLVVAYDTSSYYTQHLCQVISNSFHKCQSYGPTGHESVTDGQTDGRSLFLYPPFFFEKAKDKNDYSWKPDEIINDLKIWVLLMHEDDRRTFWIACQ
jgi:hypothetical protein